MTERQEEQIALHALSTLSPEEVRLLESEWRYDPRMREEFAEFQDAAAHMALLLPVEEAPADLRDQVLAKLREHRRSGSTPFSLAFRLVRHPVVAWAAAAAIAVGAFGLWARNRQMEGRAVELARSEAAAQGEAAKARAVQQDLEKQLADATTKASGLATELERVKQNFTVARMEVAMLKSGLKRYEEGVALVVWNQEKQEGLIELSHMPAPLPKKDYQLWVICRLQPAPVNAGVVKVDDKGAARITFKCTKHVAEAVKFAISMEAEGGVPEKPADSPIILAGR